MKQLAGLSLGCVNSSVGRIIREHPEFFEPFELVLVTAVDSETNMLKVRALSGLVRDYPSSRFLGEGLLLPARALLEVAQTQSLFSGFDELWCIERTLTVPKPTSLSIVGPLNLEIDIPPTGLSEWMGATGPLIGLGDGIGLNYASRDESIARAMDEYGTTA